jgi:hypothetical protein
MAQAHVIPETTRRGNLRGWAQRTDQLACVNNLRAAYTYFNNDIGGHAVSDAWAVA